ncbi:MAG: flagellar filament capping protein FliD, partial [Planctomycetes bacterium]|nr:flagellar filament capping protein FliD [Planctomycetota bacterium]
MSGISTGIGLISGINTAELINQLMALEARPITLLQRRVQGIDIQRTAFVGLSAQLLAIRNAATNFNSIAFFNRFNATSTNESIISATAGKNATIGSVTLRVHSLVATHAMVSSGFADPSRTSIGTGTFSIEVGRGRVNQGTDLDALNGGRGVQRGTIRITDRSGASADIDLSRAFTVQDVLEAINTNGDIQIRASVTGIASNGAVGDRIVLEDLSGGTENLVVADLDGGTMANDLGIAANVAAGRIDGADVLRLSMSMLLSSLNDGNGVDRFRQGAQSSDLAFSTSYGDFGVSLTDVLGLDTDLRAVNDGNGVRLGVIRITDRSGASAEVDLTEARTIRDVIEAINEADVSVSATTVNSRILVTDTTDVPESVIQNFKIEDISGQAAKDLGIESDVADDAINGQDIYRMVTLGDLIRAINFASGNDSLVEASLSDDGKGIVLRALGFDNQVTITAGNDAVNGISYAAADLGLEEATFSTNNAFRSRSLVGGLNTVMLRSLNGGSGVEVGTVSFTDGSNQTTSIDFSSARTLKDVVDLINADATTSLSASINTPGTGITIRDASGGGSAVLIRDVTGALATDLNLAGTFELTVDETIESGNLQRQYVSRQTLLSDLNGGTGVSLGSFRITASNGTVYHMNLADNLETVGQVIDAINRVQPDAVSARINDSGDGIVLEDKVGGSLTLTVEDVGGGQVASDLRLAGTADVGQTFIDGSYETRIEIGGGDTLEDIVRKLNAARAGISASILNDGGSINPYSLTITSDTAGRMGEMVIDTGGLDLGLRTLTEAQDALVSVGTGSGAASVLITSSKNVLEDVIPGVTINLLSPGEQDVTITTAQDIDGIIQSIQTFVGAYNDLQESIDTNTNFDTETLQRGPLLGDPTPGIIRSRLQGTIYRAYGGDGA